MKKSNLLIPDEPPVVFQKTVAIVVGVNEAMILQQLYYMTYKTSMGRLNEGKRWVFNTYEDWQKSYFPFWSIPTIQRSFTKLEEGKFIESSQLDKGFSRRKHYHLPMRVVKLFALDNKKT